MTIATPQLSTDTQCIARWQAQLIKQVRAESVLCYDDGIKTYVDLARDVASLLEHLKRQAHPVFSLWSADSYHFLVGFFACLVSSKTVVLPPNNIQQTMQMLALQGIIELDVAVLLAQAHREANLQANAEAQVERVFETVDWQAIAMHANIIFFSSGSTGEPKKIARRFIQLLLEIDTLQHTFGLPEQAVMLATVSHQHIYGLLFKLLWPMWQGGAFYTPQLAYPEHILHQAIRFSAIHQVWLISSPAFLKRWQAGVSAQPLQQIVSSGGVLPAHARTLFDVDLTEVLGSTETGGIACRHSAQTLWQPLADVEIEVGAKEGALAIKSRHALNENWIETGDSAVRCGTGFQLGSRLDRIVKLEEKRLSLDAIEATLRQQDCIEDAHVLLIEPVVHRQQLACVCVLTKNLQQQLKKNGKKAIVRQIKQQLTGHLESIAIPRQWRFVRQLPSNSQAKLNKQDIRALFMSQQLPLARLLSQQEQKNVHLELEFMPEQIYFQGHFPDFPIYPGVAQIAMVDAFAQQYFAVSGRCISMEQIKFMRLIRPYDVLQLVLEYSDNKVVFRLFSDSSNVASGRLIYVDGAHAESTATDACA